MGSSSFSAQSATYPESEEVPMVPARYHYRVYAHYQKEYESLQNTNYKVEVQRPKLKPTDRFKFHINVLSRSIDHSNPTSSPTRLTTLLHHAQRVGCKRFFQQGHDFLRSQLSHPDFPSASIEQLIRKLVPEVQQLFDFDHVLDDNGVGKPCANSDYDRSRQFILFLKVVVGT